MDQIEVSASATLAIAEQVRSRRGALPTGGPTGGSGGASVDGAQVLAVAAGDRADGGRVLPVSEDDFREQFSRVVVSAPAGGR